MSWWDRFFTQENLYKMLIYAKNRIKAVFNFWEDNWGSTDFDELLDLGRGIWVDLATDGDIDDWGKMLRFVEKMYVILKARGIKKPKRLAAIIHGHLAAEGLHG